MILSLKHEVSVLVVEDDRITRTCAIDSLAHYDHAKMRRYVADTAAKAMEKFLEITPDIVFMDIHLPDGNGLDLVKNMIKAQPYCYIVMMTGSSLSEDVAQARKLGARGYILKPFNMGRLHQVIEAFVTYRKELNSIKYGDFESHEIRERLQKMFGGRSTD